MNLIQKWKNHIRKIKRKILNYQVAQILDDGEEPKPMSRYELKQLNELFK